MKSHGSKNIIDRTESIFLKTDVKISLFYTEIKDLQYFEEKIRSLFFTECEENFSNILLIKETEFISNVSIGVKMILEDMYGVSVFNEKEMKTIYTKMEKAIKTDFYLKHYKLLSQAWNEYETNLQAIKKYSNKISAKNKETFSFLKNYRRHCHLTDPTAFHNCKKNSKMLEVSDESIESSNSEPVISHVICVECKKCYLNDFILLYCEPCKTEYYSSLLEKGENPEIQPATWAKYHCEALINDKMRCIKCRGVFYFNLKSNTLVCLNASCKFEAKPNSIAWSCILCKREFKCEAKIYNPMEFKLIKKGIKQVLLIKQKAKPLSVPCCKINIYSKIFFHKKECQGEIYQGEFNKKIIVVCEKCKSMNFYDKYIWTCPICFKRFRQKIKEEADDDKNEKIEIEGNLKNEQTLYNENKEERFSNNKEKKQTPIKESYVNNDGINETNTEKETSSNNNVSPDKRRTSLRPKTLIEILEERKGSQSQILNQKHQINNANKEEVKNENKLCVNIFNNKRNKHDNLNKIITSISRLETVNDESINNSNNNITISSYNNKSNSNLGTNNNVAEEEEEVKKIVLKPKDKIKVKHLNVYLNIDDNSNKLWENNCNSSRNQKLDSDNLNNITENKNLVPDNKILENDKDSSEQLPAIKRNSDQNIIKIHKDDNKIQEKENIVYNKKRFSDFARNINEQPNVQKINARPSSSKNIAEINNKLNTNLNEKDLTYDILTNTIQLKEVAVDDFKIIKLIGEGSYGKIYLIEDKNYRRYAMKKIIAHDKEDIQTFKSEIELVNSVQHPNILKIFGVCVRELDMTTFALYIIMENAISDWDQEVKKRLERRKPYSEEELIDIMKQLVGGLAFLQGKNISHRDLKPQNVLVFASNIYKVADFGEAKQIKISKQLSTLRGTELYMSPVLFEGLKENLGDVSHDTFKSDVFSLGYCFLYAATLTFNSLYDLRDVKEMKNVTAVMNKYLKNRYTSKVINLLIKMIDINERNRFDFIGLEKYLKDNF